MTRRSAILIGIGFPAGLATVPAWGASPKEFWDEKKPEDWTKDEIQELLTKSPWAREASIDYNNGPGNEDRLSPYDPKAANGVSRRTRGAIPTRNGEVDQKYKAVVRWETALPIRLASHSTSKEDPLANYVLGVTGDLPLLGMHVDEDDTQRQQRSEMLKEYSRLERKNDPIYLDKVVFQSASETLFYFSRQDPIFPEDKQVTFTTKLGPIEVKAKFILKEMRFQGKLEL
jgi:hypothetical protein